MKLYHGSKYKLENLEERQAVKAEHISVPEGELQNAIYLTPDCGFAIAVAVRPEGVSDIEVKQKPDGKGKITFEHPELFNPDQDIYIYEFESEEIPEENLEKVDENQYVAKGTKLKAKIVHEFKASEVEKYYELTNWKKEDSEVSRGINLR